MTRQIIDLVHPVCWRWESLQPAKTSILMLPPGALDAYQRDILRHIGRHRVCSTYVQGVRETVFCVMLRFVAHYPMLTDGKGCRGWEGFRIRIFRSEAIG